MLVVMSINTLSNSIFSFSLSDSFFSIVGIHLRLHTQTDSLAEHDWPTLCCAGNYTYCHPHLVGGPDQLNHPPSIAHPGQRGHPSTQTKHSPHEGKMHALAAD